MTIKPGTLCILLGRKPNICTVEGPPIFRDALGVDGTHEPEEWRYPVSLASGMEPPEPFRSRWRYWYPAASRLRPLNDPDNAPADPAYTRRKQHA